MKYRLFTSESVTEGHPDKLCDRISDGVLDDLIRQDENSRVAVETFCTTGMVIVGGEITTNGYCEINQLVRDVLLDVGYDSSEVGIDGRSCGVAVSIHAQSSDISEAVYKPQEARSGSEDVYDQIGAGDQGLMFGYACRDTDALGEEHRSVLMPLPVYLAHRLAERLSEVRRKREAAGLRPDGKTQVTIEYPDDGGPPVVHTILVSAQHDPGIGASEVEEIVRGLVLPKVVPDSVLPAGGWCAVKLLVNPSGRFEKGGPYADTGLTGRKIIADTYGGYARHGGGAFSGKDPTKVDRSGCYYARYAAKNLVAAGVADRLEIQVAYAIGRAYPLSLSFEDFGSAKVGREKIQAILNDPEIFDFRPAAIIANLDLRRPIYGQVSTYGHFGRKDLDLSWERLDRVELIRSRL
ncbi:MAG: methionine adenosyltransferase [bacterium]|jgi:S-adenosylmethionine synthetase